MHYCDNCHLVCEGPVCPYCGKAHLRAPENSDYCYLATMVSPWGEAMQELLTDAKIPCLTRQARSVLAWPSSPPPSRRATTLTPKWTYGASVG